jgi:hypothetical protein
VFSIHVTTRVLPPRPNHPSPAHRPDHPSPARRPNHPSSAPGRTTRVLPPAEPPESCPPGRTTRVPPPRPNHPSPAHRQSSAPRPNHPSPHAGHTSIENDNSAKPAPFSLHRCQPRRIENLQREGSRLTAVHRRLSRTLARNPRPCSRFTSPSESCPPGDGANEMLRCGRELRRRSRNGRMAAAPVRRWRCADGAARPTGRSDQT